MPVPSSDPLKGQIGQHAAVHWGSRTGVVLGRRRNEFIRRTTAQAQSVLATVPVDVTVPLTSDGLLVGCGWGLDCCDAAVVAEARPEGRAGAAIAACAPSATPATSALFAVD